MAGEINISRYDNNEILHKDDLQYGETRAYENLTSIIKRLLISTKDVIIQGGIVKERGTPSMNVDIESLLAFCVSTGKFAYYGSDFGPVAITNGGAQNRIDTLEVRLKETNFDELQRAYKDPNTGDITYQDWMTKIHYEMEAQVILGTEGAGVAPNHTSGWIKIAEIDVDAGESTSILNADIHNATAGYDTETNSGWTAETDATFRSKALSEIKAILRIKHKEDGDHADDVIRDAHVDWGPGAGEVDADLMPLGTAITHAPTGGTNANLTSASTVRQAVQKILDLLIDLSGVQNDAVLSRHINADAVVNEHIGPAAVRETEIDLGIDAGDVDADVLPLGTAVTSSPTGGDATNLANTSFVRAALQEAFNRLRDLSGVENGAIDSRHIGNDQVDSQHYAADSIDDEHIADDQLDSRHYKADSIDDEHINFGTGVNQVSAADLPIADAGNRLIATQLEAVTQELALLSKGFLAIVLTNYTGTGQPAIAAGGRADINGLIYYSSSEVAITGSTSNSTWYEILLTPSGSTFTTSFIAIGTGAWSDSKQGLYSGNNRVIGCVYKDASGNFVSKTILRVVNRTCRIKMDLGDWVFTSTTEKDLKAMVEAAGINIKDIRSYEVAIRNDADTQMYFLCPVAGNVYASYIAYTDGTHNIKAYIMNDNFSGYQWKAHILNLQHGAADWNSTSYNRGWLTIVYEV